MYVHPFYLPALLDASVYSSTASLEISSQLFNVVLCLLFCICSLLLYCCMLYYMRALLILSHTVGRICAQYCVRYSSILQYGPLRIGPIGHYLEVLMLDVLCRRVVVEFAL